MRFVFLLTVGCSNLEYAVTPNHVDVENFDQDVVVDKDAGLCSVEPANGLMFCHARVPAAEAALACELFDAVLAPAPDTLEFQTVMAYGGLMHFGDDTDWWITSEEYDPTFGCTLQSKYGSWTRGIDCDAFNPFVCLNPPPPAGEAQDR